MQAIGIDIGTTSICGIVIDTDTGSVIRSRTVNSNAFIKGEYFERLQSPDIIIKTAFEILDGFITPETAVIGVTGQMHGIVYTDNSGNAVSPLYTWQDERGNLPYKDTTYAKYLGSSSGYGGVTDFYNRENGIRPVSAVSMCTIHDYFVMQMCGLKRPVIHTSDAASFGGFDLKTAALVSDFDIDVTGDGVICGTYKNIPVSIAVGDNQASVFSTLTDEGEVLINIGTGSQVSAVTAAPVSGNGIEARPYFEGKYLAVGAALCGGRAYSLLKDFYSDVLSYAVDTDDEAVYSVMDKMLSVKEAPPLTVDTRFAGTRVDSTVTGSVTGITTENLTPSALTRGVLYGIAEELFGMYTSMGLRLTGAVGSGNGIRKNRHLRQVFEEIFGTKLKIPRHTEEASVGAALFALLTVGAYSSASEVQSLVRYE